ADGWIMLFDGETTFGWKAEGNVTASNGTIAVGGAKDSILTSTTSFGPGVLRITYRVHGNQPAMMTWRGQAKFVTGRPEPSDTTEEVTGEGQQLSPIQFRGGANAKWVIRAVAFRPTGLQPIFNGKDLSGWKVFPGERYKSKFTVTPEGWLNVTNGPG